MKKLWLIFKHSGLLSALLNLLVSSQCINAQEHGDEGNIILWQQRVYPHDTIPQNAFANATMIQQQNRTNFGFDAPSATQWTSIGPPLSVAGAGRIASVKYDPNNSNIIYVAAHGGGVWKSTDGGSNFVAKTNGLPTQSSGAICIDPNNSSIIYYSTGGNVENFWYNYYGTGVFKSTDGGENWSGGYNTGLPQQTYSYRILVNPNPSYSNIVYLAERTGLYRSTDVGITWTKAHDMNGANIPGSCQGIVTSNNGSIVYAVGGYSGLQWPPGNPGMGYWKSTNYGANFTQISNSGFAPSQRTAIAISSENDSYIYCITQHSEQIDPDPNTYQKVYTYVSTDGGSNFTLTFNVAECTEPNCGMQSDFLFIEASPLNHSTVVFGFGNAYHGEGLFLSTNGANNFSQLGGNYGADQNCFTFSPSSSQQMLLGDDSGLWYSADLGSSWTGLNSSLALSECYRVTSDVSNPDFIMTGVEDGDWVKTINGGTSWTRIGGGYDGTNALISAFDPTHVLGSQGACFCVKYSNDGGNSFGYSDITGIPNWISIFKEDHFLPGVFFCPMQGRQVLNQDIQININLSTNYGQHWEPNNNSQLPNFKPITTGDAAISPQSIAICKADTNIIYVTTFEFLGNNPGCRVYKTTNAGQIWINLNVVSHGIPNRYISSVATDPARTNIVYLTLSGFNNYGTGDEGHVFKSVNGGASWFNISNLPDAPGVPNMPANAMLIKSISSTKRELFVATDAGIYSSIDQEYPPLAGNVWKEVAAGLPNSIAMDLNFDQFPGKMRVATFGRGIYEVLLLGQVYINGTEIINSGTNGINICGDIIIDNGNILKIPNNTTIRMPANKKIIVKDGGQIDCSSGNAVTFTSQSGSWGGIEFQGTGYGTLNNCTFTNTETPIAIDGSTGASGPGNSPAILINNCTFNNGSVTASYRNNVTISRCTTNTASNSTARAYL